MSLWLGLIGLLAIVGAALAAALWALPHLRDLRRRVIETHETQTSLRVSLIAADQMSRSQAALPAPPAESVFSAGTWTQIGGDGVGWEADTFYKVRSIVCDVDILHVSVTGPKQDGPRGEVWSLSGGEWRCIGGRGQNDWTGEQAFVDQLALHDGALYAGAAHGLWRFEHGRWMQIALLPTQGKAGPYAFATTPDGLAMSLWGDPGVAILKGNNVQRLPSPRDGWGKQARTVYCLSRFQGQLYAGTGTGKLSGPSSSVFRFDGREWEKIAGEGIRGSWSQTGIPFVLSLRVFGDRLIATLSRPSGTPALASNVWAFDGHCWAPVAAGRTPEKMAQSSIMNDALVYGGQLVVATGDSRRCEPRIWALDEAQNWNDVSGNALETDSDLETFGIWVYCLASDGVSLFAGSAGQRGGARLFRYTPQTSGGKRQ